MSGLTQAQVESEGLKVEKNDPTDRPLEVVDRETGHKLTTEVMVPEPGFDFNPGRSYWEMMENVVRERLESYPPELALQVKAELMPVIEEKMPKLAQDDKLEE